MMEIVTIINEGKIILFNYKSICKNSYYNRDNYKKIYKKQQASINYNNGNSLNK